MKVIQPNCRIQFTAEDVRFIVDVLSRKQGDDNCLIRLLSDEDSRDQILDNECLYQAVLEHHGCLRISNHLYFYLLVRHMLRHAGIDDRAVADYVAELLAEFSRSDRARCLVPGGETALEYFFEMLGALRTADERTRFFIRAYIGNHSLFLAGVFPDRIRFRAESRGFPDLRYYEELGRSNYRVASDHRLAEKYSLDSIFYTLAEHFQTARLALNEIANRLLFLGDNDPWPADNQFRA